MRKKAIVTLLIALASLVFGSPVQAATSQDVTVVAVPNFEGLGKPTNFTLTRISDKQVDITWTKGQNAINTLIKAKMGAYPSDKDDGYQVYFGPDTSFSDTALDLDEMSVLMHYRAWSEALGEYSVGYAQGRIGGMGMTLLALCFVVVGLTVAMFVTKQMMLGFPCVIFWGVLGGYAYGESTATWDWQYILFFASMGMVMFSALAMYGLRERRDTIADIETDEELAGEAGLYDEEQESEPSARVKALRSRASRRKGRAGVIS